MELFFDFDGTLLDVSKRHYTVYCDIISQLGGKPISRQLYWKYKRRQEHLANILRFSFLDAKYSHQFSDLFIRNVENSKYLKLDKPFFFTKPTLDKLFGRYDLFLISFRKRRTDALKQIEGNSLAAYFKGTKVGRPYESGVASKASFIRELTVRPERGLVIGDTEEDIMVAKKLNMISVALLSGIRNRNMLEKASPDYILVDISQIPNLLVDIR